MATQRSVPAIKELFGSEFDMGSDISNRWLRSVGREFSQFSAVQRKADEEKHRAYREAIELGRHSQTPLGFEQAAKAAFNLAPKK